MHRRDFLKTTAAVGSVFILPTTVLGDGPASANNRMNLAFIGIGNRAKALLHGPEGDNIVAICDVDAKSSSMDVTWMPSPAAWT